jgi:hypothetical protein
VGGKETLVGSQRCGPESRVATLAIKVNDEPSCGGGLARAKR